MLYPVELPDHVRYSGAVIVMFQMPHPATAGRYPLSVIRYSLIVISFAHSIGHSTFVK